MRLRTRWLTLRVPQFTGWAALSRGIILAMEPAQVRAWWIRTIVTNLVGIALLLIGWAMGVGQLLALGLLVLVLSLALRIAVQLHRAAEFDLP